MDVEKKVLCRLDYCYAVSGIGKKQEILFASEGHHGCYGFDSLGNPLYTVWEGPGGTMGMVEVPDESGDFLAIQQFFPTFQSEKACIVWVHRLPENQFSVTHLVTLPYVHRFDLIKTGDVTYLIACTLCEGKEKVDDWSKPGMVYVGVLPKTPEEGIELHPILEGLYKNHGFCSGRLNGRRTSLITSENGVYAVCFAPDKKDWNVEKILDQAVSDIAIVDIDQDGVDELVTIEPFHGDQLAIYHKEGDSYRKSFTYNTKIPFAHALWGGNLCGEPTVVCGYRAGEQELFLLKKGSSGYVSETIDSGIGPSNICVLHQEDGDLICSANRQAGEAAIYRIKK